MVLTRILNVDKQTAKTQSFYHKYSAEKKEMSHETVVYLFFYLSGRRIANICIDTGQAALVRSMLFLYKILLS